MSNIIAFPIERRDLEVARCRNAFTEKSFVEIEIAAFWTFSAKLRRPELRRGRDDAPKWLRNELEAILMHSEQPQLRELCKEALHSEKPRKRA